MLGTGAWLGAAGLGRGREGLRARLSGRMDCLCNVCILPNILCPWLVAIGYRQFLLGVKVWSLGCLQAHAVPGIHSIALMASPERTLCARPGPTA